MGVLLDPHRPVPVPTEAPPAIRRAAVEDCARATRRQRPRRTPLKTTAIAKPALAPEASVSVSWALVKSGFTQPVQVTSAPDGSGRFFIVTKTGKVWIYKNGAVLSTPYLDLTSLVSTDSERGLLSIAFPPWFTATPSVFVAYTALNGTLVVSRFTATAATRTSASPGPGAAAGRSTSSSTSGPPCLCMTIARISRPSSRRRPSG
jgi:hypothetical protein